ncbi:MAG: hypothetical protein LBE56_12845 [Tannerella sp.]|nr:hypothetical protein [Tannerella sp.]
MQAREVFSSENGEGGNRGNFERIANYLLPDPSFKTSVYHMNKTYPTVRYASALATLVKKLKGVRQTSENANGKKTFDSDKYREMIRELYGFEDSLYNINVDEKTGNTEEIFRIG